MRPGGSRHQWLPPNSRAAAPNIFSASVRPPYDHAPPHLRQSAAPPLLVINSPTTIWTRARVRIATGYDESVQAGRAIISRRLHERKKFHANRNSAPPLLKGGAIKQFRGRFINSFLQFSEPVPAPHSCRRQRTTLTISDLQTSIFHSFGHFPRSIFLCVLKLALLNTGPLDLPSFR